MGPAAEDSAARAWVASGPRRRIVTSMTSGPAGTGAQKMAVADSGRCSGRSISAAIARKATVMRTPPDGVK